uniref:Retrotransposon gag domain-containing protein n=1 Tax=Vitis vinifera TaxID=29760 RepID=A5ANJ5_VITVI|nr:hypothetical protein VITISV_010066 [Vitis vinifera]
MSSSMNQLLETMCGGDFMSKNPEEAMDFLSYMAEVSRGWDEPNKGEVGKTKSQTNAFNAKVGMYTLNEDIDMKAKVAAMTRRLEELELKKIHEVEAVVETPVQVKPFPICQSYEHLVEECPTIPTAREMFGDQANVKDLLEWQVLGERYKPLQGAPAGHESAETPIGHETNGAVAGDRTSNQMVPLPLPLLGTNQMAPLPGMVPLYNDITLLEEWDEPNARDMGRMTSQPKAKGEMYILNDGMNMKAEIAAMERRLEELEMTNMQPVQAISQTPLQAMPCAICLSYEHLGEECPTIPAEREMFAMVNLCKFVGDFVGKQEATNARVDQRIDSMESTLNKRMDEMQNDMAQKLDILQDSISRLANLNTVQEKENSPSQPYQNSMSIHEMEAKEGEPSQKREVKEVITLRSGFWMIKIKRNCKEIEEKKIGAKSESNGAKNRGKTRVCEISQPLRNRHFVAKPFRNTVEVSARIFAAVKASFGTRVPLRSIHSDPHFAAAKWLRNGCEISKHEKSQFHSRTPISAIVGHISITSRSSNYAYNISFEILGSHESIASNGTQFGFETEKLWPFEDDCANHEWKCRTSISLLLDTFLKNFLELKLCIRYLVSNLGKSGVQLFKRQARKAEREFHSRDAIWKGVSQLRNHFLAHNKITFNCEMGYENSPSLRKCSKLQKWSVNMPLFCEMISKLRNGCEITSKLRNGLQIAKLTCEMEEDSISQEVPLPPYFSIAFVTLRTMFSLVGGRVEEPTLGKLLDSKETSISYLLRAFEGKSKVKDHLEWQVLGERYEPWQGAPAGHESAETPIGHESNGIVAGDRTSNQMVPLPLPLLGTNQMAPLPGIEPRIKWCHCH